MDLQVWPERPSSSSFTADSNRIKPRRSRRSARWSPGMSVNRRPSASLPVSSMPGLLSGTDSAMMPLGASSQRRLSPLPRRRARTGTMHRARGSRRRGWAAAKRSCTRSTCPSSNRIFGLSVVPPPLGQIIVSSYFSHCTCACRIRLERFPHCRRLPAFYRGHGTSLLGPPPWRAGSHSMKN